MIRLLKIFLIIAVLLVIGAPSCGDEQADKNREESILRASRDSIRDVFETDYLTETTLMAYEAVAKQKLSDFTDYFKIMTEPSLDMSFRIKASEMIKSIFLSDHSNVQIISINESTKKLDVLTLINCGLENKLSTSSFTFDSIRIHEPLHRISDDTYSGSLGFAQNFTDSVQPEQIIKSECRIADIFVLKEEKDFGSDTLKIWTVRLGEIR